MKFHMPKLAAGIVVCCLLLLSVFASAQTPGLIVRPAGGPYSSVLDPNQDGFTSLTTSGFTGTSDVGVGNSEIVYKIVPPFKLEPTSDLMRGPNERFTDLVRLTADESGMYVYNDGTNMLFRLRLGAIVPGSKGYSILIDADQKFGAVGPNADPNYQAATNGNNGNPGFEFEIVLETNFRVAIYNVDGGSSPVLLSSYSIASNSQISLALSTVSTNPDYFYDFYVPLSALTSPAVTITATTPIRISATTVMDPGPALGGPKSDIYGYDGNDYMKAWETIIANQPAFTPDAVKSTGTGINPTCTAAPVLNPISAGTVTVGGTWAPTDPSQPASANITLYRVRGGVTTTFGPVANTGSTWSIANVNAAANDVFYATAISSGQSSCFQSNSVTVVSCTALPAAPALTCASRKGITGTIPSGATVLIYQVPTTTAAPTSNPIAANITYPSTTQFAYHDCAAGGQVLTTGVTYMIVTSLNGCLSKPVFECIQNNSPLTGPTTNALVISPLNPSNTAINGTGATSGDVLRLFINDQYITSISATGSSFSFTGLTLKTGDQIKVYSQAGTNCITVSSTVTVGCLVQAPFITANSSNQLAIGATISGTSFEIGATVTVYNAATNAAITGGTATVQSNGTWTTTATAATGITYYARQTSSCGISGASATISTVTGTASTRCGTITTSPLLENISSVSGTLSGAALANTVVNLYLDGSKIGTYTITTATNNWGPIAVNSTYLNTLYAGGVLILGIQEPSKLEVSCAASFPVLCVTPATPVLSPNAVTLSAGDGKTAVKIANSQAGVLYTLEDAGNVDKSNSAFGNGGVLTLTSYSFFTPGTYNLHVTALNLTTNCSSTATFTLTVTDNDGDGIADPVDIDDDNDGILDANETAAIDATGDTDSDGIPNYKDANSGTLNSNGVLASLDKDSDGIIDQFDLDADNDGIPDIVENGGTDSDNDGKVDGSTDADSDGLRDAVDANTAGAPGSNGLTVLDFDGDGVPNFKDLDADGDGILDTRESGLNADTNNDGVIKTGDTGFADANNDGWADAIDLLSSLNLTNTDNGNKPDYLDIDSDNDGIVDIIEAQITSGYLAPLGTDTDGDGIDNRYDNNTALFGGNATNGLTPVNTDGTDLPDYRDGDSDNDGYPDTIEGHDTNGDNVPDAGSNAANGIPGGTTDADGDGLLDGYDNNPASAVATNGTTNALSSASSYPNVDGGTQERDWREAANTDTDGLTNITDIDDDNDGITDVTECGGIDPLGDADADGIYNYLDPTPGGTVPTFVDANGDGISDVFDADQDGVINSLDLDSDNDGVPDLIEVGGVDTNGDGKADVATDANGNGLADLYEGGNVLTNKDTDGDGIANAQDLDSDNDGIPDVVEAGGADSNNDGKVDNNADTNGDGWSDAATGTANALIVGVDAGSDGRADSYTKGDFDGDTIANLYDLDSDGDGILDTRESGLTGDTNNDGVIKTGDTGFADANKDGWADTIDLLSSLSLLNTDGGANNDYIDIDSDDDGITDNVEGQATASYQAPLTSSTDVDKDGINDRYDNNTALFGGNSNNGISPVNTDGADLPDYRDLDADNDNDADKIEGNDLNLDKKANDVPGTVATTDTDGDGLLDFFESNINSGPVVTISGFGGTGFSGKSTAQKTLSSATERDWRNSAFSLTAYTILPVKFLSVTAVAKPTAVQVEWTVEAEQNVQYYAIERSADGARFISVGTVAYKKTTASMNRYIFRDSTAPAGRVYYRVRQVDVDGGATLSVVVSVQTAASVTKLALYPNPVHAGSQVELTAATAQQVVLLVMDAQGRMVAQQSISVQKGRNRVPAMELQPLASGTYVLAATIDGKQHQVTFIK